MRVLVLTDSLSLPRTYSNGSVHWEDIYVSLLKKAAPHIDFIHVGIGAATIKTLYEQLNYYKGLHFDLIILQCGIVDCAPRSFGLIELEIIKRLKLFRIAKPFFTVFRKYRGITYTSRNAFAKYLKLIQDSFGKTPLWTIGILPGFDEYELKVPGITQNINSYNKLLQSNATFIDMSDIPKECILDDYHHLNAKGHKFLFEKLIAQIEAFKH